MASAAIKSQQGAVNYQAGLAAERSVARHYHRRGHPFVAHRWRGKRGEIDLVMRDGDGLIFVEVKKSSTFERAATRISARQTHRVRGAVEEYLATAPNGALTDVRFDVALVNAHGNIHIIENALA